MKLLMQRRGSIISDLPAVAARVAKHYLERYEKAAQQLQRLVAAAGRPAHTDHWESSMVALKLLAKDPPPKELLLLLHSDDPFPVGTEMVRPAQAVFDMLMAAMHVVYGLAGPEERGQFFAMKDPELSKGKSVAAWASELEMKFSSIEHLPNVDPRHLLDVFAGSIYDAKLRAKAEDWVLDPANTGQNLDALKMYLSSVQGTVQRQRGLALDAAAAQAAGSLAASSSQRGFDSGAEDVTGYGKYLRNVLNRVVVEHARHVAKGDELRVKELLTMCRKSTKEPNHPDAICRIHPFVGSAHPHSNAQCGGQQSAGVTAGRSRSPMHSDSAMRQITELSQQLQELRLQQQRMEAGGVRVGAAGFGASGSSVSCWALSGTSVHAVSMGKGRVTAGLTSNGPATFRQQQQVPTAAPVICRVATGATIAGMRSPGCRCSVASSGCLTRWRPTVPFFATWWSAGATSLHCRCTWRKSAGRWANCAAPARSLHTSCGTLTAQQQRAMRSRGLAGVISSWQRQQQGVQGAAGRHRTTSSRDTHLHQVCVHAGRQMCQTSNSSGYEYSNDEGGY